jgi:hypothetical protein
MDRYALALVWKMIVGLWELDMSMGEARGTNILINVWLNVVSLTLKRHKFTTSENYQSKRIENTTLTDLRSTGVWRSAIG